MEPGPALRNSCRGSLRVAQVSGTRGTRFNLVGACPAELPTLGAHAKSDFNLCQK